MATFNVTDSDGNENLIDATEEYVKATYASYEEVIMPRHEPDQTLEARKWRDKELKDTDWIAQTPDYPNRAAYLTYRQKLRDWPSTGDFPDTRPTL